MLAAGGLVTLALVGSAPITPPSQPFHEFNEPRAEAFVSGSGEGGYRVLMLGNSRLKYATWNRSDLEALAEKTPSIEILRLVNDWATFSDFEPFMDTILERPPDLVLIQLELMSQERSTSSNVRFLRVYLKWLLFGSKGETWNPGGLDQWALQYETPCAGIEPTPEAVERRLNRTGKWLTHDPHGQSSLAARRFVEELRRRGVRVAFLSIPRTDAMEAERPETRLTSDALSDQERAGIWRYPGQPTDAAFCDTIHLSADGRGPFSAWLMDEIVRALPIRDDAAIASNAPQ